MPQLHLLPHGTAALQATRDYALEASFLRIITTAAIPRLSNNQFTGSSLVKGSPERNFSIPTVKKFSPLDSASTTEKSTLIEEISIKSISMEIAVLSSTMPSPKMAHSPPRACVWTRWAERLRHPTITRKYDTIRYWLALAPPAPTRSKIRASSCVSPTKHTAKSVSLRRTTSAPRFK